MASVSRVFAVVVALIALMLQVSNATVYKVGDSAGWTTIGNINYKEWAATKTFQVGDVITFVYGAQFHNVLRVTHAMYRSCNASVPIESFGTGNDSITMKTKGHHFFLCGVPGHCQAGQKVDINVRITTSSTAPTPSALPSPSPLPSPTEIAAKTPAPSPNMAASLKSSLLGLIAIAALAFIVSG